MIRMMLAVALGVGAGVVPERPSLELPNPLANECFLVGDDIVESEPTFTQPATRITEFTLFQICGEMHPTDTAGEFIQRDEFKILVMDQAQAELIVRAAQDWIEQGLLEPDTP